MTNKGIRLVGGLIIIIDRIALAKQGDNRFGHIRPSVYLSFCQCALSWLNRLTSKEQ